uniref:ATP synthase F0 subunit 8 n=1 Tax=Panagrolaimus sp. JU765 TaxID=591449 RepID=A0AC34QRY2_9BILA
MADFDPHPTEASGLTDEKPQRWVRFDFYFQTEPYWFWVIIVLLLLILVAVLLILVIFCFRYFWKKNIKPEENRMKPNMSKTVAVVNEVKINVLAPAKQLPFFDLLENQDRQKAFYIRNGQPRFENVR